MNGADRVTAAGRLAGALRDHGMGSERLPWLPRARLGVTPPILAVMACGAALMPMAVLATDVATLARVLSGLVSAVFVGAVIISLLHARNRDAAGSHLTVDWAAGLLRLRCLPLDFSMDVPLDEVEGIALRSDESGMLILVRRIGGPSVMASGHLSPAEAESQALRLAALIDRPFQHPAPGAAAAAAPSGPSPPHGEDVNQNAETSPASVVVIAASRHAAINSTVAWIALGGGAIGLIIAVRMGADWGMLSALGLTTLLVAWALHRWLPDTPAYFDPPRRIEVDGHGCRLRSIGGPASLGRTGWIAFDSIHELVLQPIEDSDNLTVELQRTDHPAIPLTGALLPNHAEDVAYRIAALAGCAVRTRRTAKQEA